MNETLSTKYPTVQVTTPMPAGAPSVLEHRGQLARLPARFDHGTATYLLSLFEPDAARRLCQGEQFEPILITVRGGARQAVGFVAVIDYHQTDVGPYREWILALWATPRGQTYRELTYVNPTSLTFYAMLADDMGFSFFSPKMILTEQLPIEVGVEYYGIPKELGQVVYERSAGRAHVEVATAEGPWIMKATVPTSRGGFGKLKAGIAAMRAFGPAALFRSARRKELPCTLLGSAKLAAKRCLAIGKVDPTTQFMAWDGRDCELAVNPDSEWGGVLRALKFAPSLICHIPNIAFVLSGPFDQAGQKMPAVQADNEPRAAKR